MDISLWRARIGMFNGYIKAPHPKLISKSDRLYDVALALINIISFSCNCLFKLIIAFSLCCILCTLLVDMAYLFISNHIKRKYMSKETLFTSLLTTTLNLPFILIVLRILLLCSGTVESNPGPAPKLLSLGCWNLDSLLARDGIKKSYIEAIQSVNNFDLFGICETYLTPNIPNSSIEIEGFSKMPFRSDYKHIDRPRGVFVFTIKITYPSREEMILNSLMRLFVLKLS